CTSSSSRSSASAGTSGWPRSRNPRNRRPDTPVPPFLVLRTSYFVLFPYPSPMSVAPGRKGAIAFFVTFGVCLVALAAALNVGWVVLTWEQVAPLLVGVFIFAAIITGLILNTTFLVREIRRNEQHDAFVNAVTHELKTPVTSIRLHLETLRARADTPDSAKRREFCDVMRDDSARLLHTIAQV